MIPLYTVAFLIFGRCITISIMITDAAALPKNKVVIAYTGFDDKQSLLQTLRQLIKTIKRRVSDGEVVITPINENTTEKINSESNNAMEIGQQDTESNLAIDNRNNTCSTSCTSVNSLVESNALSPGAKKTRGRPRGGSNTSRDSNNNATSDKHQTVEVSVGSADKRVRGRSRYSSTAENENEDIQSDNNMNPKHTTTTTTTNTTTSPKKKTTTTTTTENHFIAPEEMIAAWQIEALECSVSILSSQTDFSAASCTHVIVNANSNA